MVKLEDVHAANARLVERQPIVAVFTGATSGIGEYSLRALAKAHAKDGKGLRVYLLGRNEKAAEKIFADCRISNPTASFEFVKAEDLTLLREIDRCCEEVVKREREEETKGNGTARVDMLIMSQGCVDFGGRNETKEGLDKSMSLLYYSRMRCIVQLLPLLQSSSLPAHVISVYAAGMEGSGKLFTRDLSLRDSAHYGFASCRATTLHMKTMFFESLAQQNPGQLSLVHMYPFIVVTPAFYSDSVPTWFKIARWILGPLVKAIAVSPQEIGDRTLFLAGSKYPPRTKGDKDLHDYVPGEIASATDGVVGGGAYAVSYTGEAYKPAKTYLKLRSEGFREAVWEHTNKAFDAIESSGTFKE